MQFKAKYRSLKPTWVLDDSPEHDYYYRTIHADSVNESLEIARRYCRKGYVLVIAKQDLGKE